jgi:hypothetical protein
MLGAYPQLLVAVQDSPIHPDQHINVCTEFHWISLALHVIDKNSPKANRKRR